MKNTISLGGSAFGSRYARFPVGDRQPQRTHNQNPIREDSVSSHDFWPRQEEEWFDWRNGLCGFVVYGSDLRGCATAKTHWIQSGIGYIICATWVFSVNPYAGNLHNLYLMNNVCGLSDAWIKWADLMVYLYCLQLNYSLLWKLVVVKYSSSKFYGKNIGNTRTQLLQEIYFCYCYSTGSDSSKIIHFIYNSILIYKTKRGSSRSCQFVWIKRNRTENFILFNNNLRLGLIRIPYVWSVRIINTISKILL